MSFQEKTENRLGPEGSTNLKHISVCTKFAHHGEKGGYKQLLRFTRPQWVTGIDETSPQSLFQKNFSSRYKWLYEFSAAAYARMRQIPLIHLLYAEEYFRFS